MDLKETCKNCKWAKEQNEKDLTKNNNVMLCTRYNMYTDSHKSCKVYRQRETENGN